MSARLDRPWTGGTQPMSDYVTRRALHLGLRGAETFPQIDDGGFKARLFWRGLAVLALVLIVCAWLGIETAP